MNLTFNELEVEYNTIANAIPLQNVKSILDIGCGHGFIDLFFARRYNSDVHLVDIEVSDDVRHGYHSTGSGYASLEAAKIFLANNGIRANKIRTTNPNNEPLEIEPNSVDLAMSLLSAGFHYPISSYSDIVLKGLKTGGVFVFDARNETGQIEMLNGFSEFFEISVSAYSKRIMAIK